MLNKNSKSFRDRMNFLAERERNPSAMARRCGLSVTALRNYLNGGEPTRPTLQKIADRMTVSLEWLINGTGNMEASNDATGPSRVSIPFVPSQALASHWPPGGSASDLLSSASESFILDLDWARRYSGIQAPPALVLRMENQSMEPTIRAGDFLFVDATDTVLRHGIFALILKGATIVTRVIYHVPEEIRLVADNERYGTTTLSVNESAPTFRLIGRVAFRWGQLAA